MKRLFLALLFLLCAAPLAAEQLPYANTPMWKATGAGVASDTTSLAVPVTDCYRFREVSVQLLGTWAGVVTFEISNDGTNWVGILLAPPSTGTGALTAAANGIWSGPINAGFFRARFSTATSGSPLGTALFFTVGN